MTGEPFDITLARYGLSLYLNRYELTDVDDYGISGLNLCHTYSVDFTSGDSSKHLETELIGFNPLTAQENNYVNMKQHCLYCIKKTSEGEDVTDFNVTNNGTGNIKIWTYYEK